MHRILLYALVVALFVFAWDARRGVALAMDRESTEVASAEVAGGAQGGAGNPGGPGENYGDHGARADFGDRLDARVARRGDSWGQFAPDQGRPEAPEAVLAGAEAWLEASFPEGGGTAAAGVPGKPQEGLESEATDAAGVSESSGLAHEGSGERRPGGEPPTGEEGPEPVYVAAAARIESMSGSLPIWSGLLDMALQPAAAQPQFDGSSPGDVFAPGDTAWLSDDRGRLIARIEALEGVGLEFDPAWPWLMRQRNLLLSDARIAGFAVREYRLILVGNGLIPSWSGRLVLIHSRLGGSTGR